MEIESAGDALFLAESLSKDKKTAITWLEDAIISAREEMLKNLNDHEESLKFHKIIKALENALYDLKNTNVNTRLALENLFLSI